MRCRRGFTLIELVIVVAIVGILASATVPLARWGVKRSKEHQLQESLRILRNAIDQYHDAARAGLIEVPEDNPGYPPDLEVLVEGVPLTGQMPPVAPGVSDEYGATGPGLAGGLEAQLQEGQGAAAGAGGLGAPGALGGSGGMTETGRGGQGVRFGGFGSSGDSGADRRGAGLAGRIASRRGGRQEPGRDPGPSGGRDQRGLGGSRGVTFGQFGGEGGEAGAAEPLLGPDGEPLKLIFLRRIPVDPMTGEREWGKRCYGEPPDDRLWCGRNVFDVYSKSLDRSIEGNEYRDW